jgi:hypothetical protein
MKLKRNHYYPVSDFYFEIGARDCLFRKIFGGVLHCYMTKEPSLLDSYEGEEDCDTIQFRHEGKSPWTIRAVFYPVKNWRWSWRFVWSKTRYGYDLDIILPSMTLYYHLSYLNI